MEAALDNAEAARVVERLVLVGARLGVSNPFEAEMLIFQPPVPKLG